MNSKDIEWGPRKEDDEKSRNADKVTDINNNEYNSKSDRQPPIFVSSQFLERVGEWTYLAVLGFIMAVLSFIMDYGVSYSNKGRQWLFTNLTDNVIGQYFAWMLLPLLLVILSAGVARYVSPPSIGSGIPQMKTILQGVPIKEYLTFRTLIAKVVGLTATLGSGLPLGKEGPFVHIACISAALLSKLFGRIKLMLKDGNRNHEMLAAACAIGVASCFGAPIGGVLFSIEVTTAYFAVKNYWRGFFAAVCGATLFKLLAVWFKNEDSLKAIYQTNFPMDFPYDPLELFVFSLMGLACGIGGAFYVWTHRQFVLFMKRYKRLDTCINKIWIVYPSIVILIVSALSCPLGLGKYIAGDLNTHDQMEGLFSNFTWTKAEYKTQEWHVLNHWLPNGTDVFDSLTAYIIYTFIFSIIAATVAVPSGSFLPVFKIGAALGRMTGELMHLAFPTGIRILGPVITEVIPGGYATVGAAAFSGAVTHTISTSVILFEMTGQITHIIPIMIAVIIANGIATLLQPSIYDSIIQLRKLPYLPEILPQSSGIHKVRVEDFMIRDVKFIWKNMTYRQLNNLLKNNQDLRRLPLVENKESMILCGTIQKIKLIKILEKEIDVTHLLKKKKINNKTQQRRHRITEDTNDDNDDDINLPTDEISPAPDILDPEQPSINQTSSSHTELTHSIQELEGSELNKKITFNDSYIETVLFQLGGKTPLVKVHSIFSLNGVNHAFVTDKGKLIGVVGIQQLRKAIEDVNNGNLPVMTTQSEPLNGNTTTTE